MTNRQSYAILQTAAVSEDVLNVDDVICTLLYEMGTVTFAKMFAQPDVWMSTYARLPSMMRLAQALGISDYIPSVDQFVEYTKKRLAKP